jgi:hypothetical protein
MYQQVIVGIYQLGEAVGLAVCVLSVTCRANSTIDNASSIHNYIQINLGLLLQLILGKIVWNIIVKKIQNNFSETIGFLNTEGIEETVIIIYKYSF